MKKTKIIIPALAMLLLSTAASVSGTVAWFSMNNSVTVTGMTVTTKVSSNLLIAETNLDANYSSDITQSINGLLEPASSINAVNFYWTAGTNVAANGDAKTETYVEYDEDTTLSNTYAKKDKYDNEFIANYGFAASPASAVTVTGESPNEIYTHNVCYGYVDYAFYLKATNSASTSKNINLTKLALKYNGGAVSANDKAWRVGLMVQNATANTETSTALASADVVSIFTLPGAENFDNTPKAIGDNSGTGALLPLSYGVSSNSYNQAGTVASLASGVSGYYKVTVRLWLEGEDKTCTNETYASLTESWTLDLAFEFATETAAVTNIARFGTVKLGATSETTSSAKINNEGENVTFYAYETSTGLTVYGDAATVAASTKFYSIAAGVATEIAANLAALA